MLLKELRNLKFRICHFVFTFYETWDHVEVKDSKDIISESTYQIRSQTSLYTTGKGFYQSS